MLEGLMKGLALWLYGLFLEIVEFIADSLLEVFNMDLAYFESNVPVTKEIVTILIAAGWAILIGNLAFQSLKAMMSGIGFEGEDPKILFCRTFVFSFLLVASRQICEIGLGMTAYINTLLKTPDAVRLDMPPLDVFTIPGSWLLVMIIGLVLMFQIVKFFFEIAERYVVLVMLTILSPLAFGVGGSKNTEDIFKGWARMYGSACLMMLFNTVFLKLLLSAMGSIPSGSGMLPWLMLVVAIARVARKIDDIVSRIGLNVARTGDPIGKGGMMYPIMVMRTLGQLVSKTAASNSKAPQSPGAGRRPGGGSSAPSPPPTGGSPSGPTASGGSVPSHRNDAEHTASSGAVGGVQPVMSTVTPSGTGSGKEPPPSRPPIGGVRGAMAPGRYGGTRDDAQTDNRRQESENKPPLSVDSAVPGAASRNRSSHGRSPDAAQQNRTDRGVGGKQNSSTPPLSVDSRKPDLSAAAKITMPGTQTASQPGQPSRPSKKRNIDIFRDDEPQGPASSVGGSRPVSGSGARSSASPSSGSVSRQSGSVSHTQSRIHTTDSSVARSSVNNTAKASPSGNASSPAAGRVSRGVGSHGNGGVVVPGSTQRVPSPPSTRQRVTPPEFRGSGSSPPKQAGSVNTPQHSHTEAQPSQARPMRYRMAGQTQRKQPQRPKTDRSDIQPPRRPASGQQGYRSGMQNPTPKQGGENKI